MRSGAPGPSPLPPVVQSRDADAAGTWVATIQALKSEIVPADGKSVRGNFSTLHMEIDASVANHATASIPAEYLVGDCNARGCNFMLSTALQHTTWVGLR